MECIDFIRALYPFFYCFHQVLMGSKICFGNAYIAKTLTTCILSCWIFKWRWDFRSTWTLVLVVLGRQNPFDYIPRICWICNTYVIIVDLFVQALFIIAFMIALIVTRLQSIGSSCCKSLWCIRILTNVVWSLFVA